MRLISMGLRTTIFEVVKREDAEPLITEFSKDHEVKSIKETSIIVKRPRIEDYRVYRYLVQYQSKNNCNHRFVTVVTPEQNITICRLCRYEHVEPKSNNHEAFLSGMPTTGK